MQRTSFRARACDARQGRLGKVFCWTASTIALAGYATLVPVAAAGVLDTANVSTASHAVTDLTHWVVQTHDNGGMPYLIVDKVNAQVLVFDPSGRLQAAAPALLGLAHGDLSGKGIGDKKMSAIHPQDRITPAGRFVASLSHNAGGEEILWIDYDDAIALHPVVKGTPQERRAERLASPTSADNRISYGCINVPLKFYREFVSPAFAHTSGVVYILPEEQPVRVHLGAYPFDVDSNSRATMPP
jgi:hypothetical protein